MQVPRKLNTSVHLQSKLKKSFWKTVDKKCLDNRDKLIPAYYIIVKKKDALLKALFCDQQVTGDVSNKFSNNLPNTTLNSHTLNITFENKIFVTEELNPESPFIKENKFPRLTCIGQNSDLNKP